MEPTVDTDSYSERARTWLTPEEVTRLKTGGLDGRYQLLRDRDDDRSPPGATAGNFGRQ